MTTTTEATMDLMTLTPAQIDALWFPLDAALANAQDRAEQFGAQAAKETMQYRIEQYAGWAAAEQAKADEIEAQVAPFIAEWVRRNGWTRAYLAITNGNGHVHSTTHCSTLHRGRRSTSLAPLAEVSGLDTAEIIDLAGERACTICYPGAPVSVLQQATRLFSKDEIKAKADRDVKSAKLAEKKTAAAAKAITNPDGSPLIGTDKWDEIKTERTAWTKVVDLRLYARFGYRAQEDVQERIVAALAHKLGKTTDEINAEVDAKMAAKIKREKIEVPA